MALINPGSTDIIPESLDLHSTLPTQVACEKVEVRVYLPKNPIERDTPIHFKVVSNDNDMIYPYHTYIRTRMKIINANGTDIAENIGGHANLDRNVLAVDGIGSAWIQLCEVKINNKRVSSNDLYYAHRADMNNRLSYSLEVKHNSLQMSGVDTEAAAFETIAEADLHLDDDNPADYALKRRYQRTKCSKEFHNVSRVHTEICEQGKLLPANTVLDFTFHPNESAFTLLSKRGANYRLKILEAKLYIDHVKINPTIGRDLEDVSAKGNKMTFPVRRVEVTYYTRGLGATDLSHPAFLTGKKPRRLFFGVIDLEAFHGTKGRDPFNFHHFNAREVAIRVNGETIPAEGLRMNFTNNADVFMPLMYLLKTCDSFMTQHDIGINLDNYRHRNAIYGFDLTATGAPPGTNFELTSNANIDFRIILSEATTRNVAVVVYAEYDSEILISHDRMVEYNQ